MTLFTFKNYFHLDHDRSPQFALWISICDFLLRARLKFESRSKPFEVTVRTIHPSWVIVLISLLLATIGNLSLWHELTRLPEMDDLRALWFGIAFSILIASLICIVLSLLCWRWTLKPIISLFVLSATVGNYYMLSYGVVIDVNMIDNILQTDAAEFLNLIGWKLLLVIILYAVLPITALYRIQIKTLSALQQLSHNIMDFTRFCRQTSTSKLKLFKRKRAQLVKMTVPSHSIIETLNVVKYF